MAARRIVPGPTSSCISRVIAASAVAALSVAWAGSAVLTASAQPPSSRPVDPWPVPVASTAAAPESPALRQARVAERAAQRAERLTRTAEQVDRTALDAAGAARQRRLAAANTATEGSAAEVAAEKLRRARANRPATESAAQPTTAPTTAPTTQPAGEPAAGAASVDPRGVGSDPTPDGPQSPNLGASSVPDAVDPASIPPRSAGVAPVPGAVVGARFGQYGPWSRYHTGLDFRAAYGTPIRAVQSGVVVYVGNSGDWAGNHVALRHADGITSMSSHMSATAVQVGQAVDAGQVIGYVGQTGRAFGPHLHFEIYPAGVHYGDVYRAVDPRPWLVAQGVVTH